MLKRMLAAAVLAAGCVASAAATLPERFAAEYSLRAGSLTVATSHVSVAPAPDGNFVYELRVALTGIVSLFRHDRTVERSEWRYDAENGLRPLAYRYERTGEEPGSVAIAFDWDDGVVHNTVRGHTGTIALPDGTLDKLSYLLALMQDLARGKRDVQYHVAEGGPVTTYRLKAVGREKLDTALGRFDTIKVQRVRQGSGEDTTFWCALDLHFLPVKVVHRQDDGMVISLYIRSVEGLGASAR
jgi:hypothetical protein